MAGAAMGAGQQLACPPHAPASSWLGTSLLMARLSLLELLCARTLLRERAGWVSRPHRIPAPLEGGRLCRAPLSPHIPPAPLGKRESAFPATLGTATAVFSARSIASPPEAV